ncbi:MAG: hypothetical protein INR69_00960 [Mucilaginibacter polytrichastri]|nr:hypothetical protein [Mucilaginibacter polytrichastri]
MKTRFLLIPLFALAACGTERHVFSPGDIVKIQQAKERFRVEHAESRKTSATGTWNGAFYQVTNLENGKKFSLPQRSLVLVERNQQPIQQPERVLAGSGE